MFKFTFLTLFKISLLCISSNNFPISKEDFESEGFEISSNKLLKLLNKSKISISSDETRHYLNGIYIHKITLENQDKYRINISLFYTAMLYNNNSY